MKIRRIILVVSLWTLTVMPAAFGQIPGNAAAPSLSNRRAPSFSLPDANYRQYDILDYRGKWLLLEFLMTKPTDCGPCAGVTGRIDALLAKHGAKLAAIGIAKTPPETQDTIRGFAAVTHTKIPIVFDSSMVAIAYFKATPTNARMDVGHVFLVNPQGTIVRDWDGTVAETAKFSIQVDALIGGEGKK